MNMQMRQQNGISILEPTGRIVGASVSELREILLPEIEGYETPRILINFANVNKVDSSGLGALMEARAMAHRKNGRIGVINVGKNIRNLLVMSRIVSEFEHFDSEDDAIAALSA